MNLDNLYKNPDFLRYFARYSQGDIKRFAQQLEDNSDVYELFKQLAYNAKAAGRTYYSAKSIIEVVRWQTLVEEREGGLKVNDRYTPMYARLLMLEDPAFRGFFRVKGIYNNTKKEDLYEFS